jgi:hypothetical protein
MNEIYQYIIGFLFGVFILMTIIIKDSWFKDWFNYTRKNYENFENGEKDSDDGKDSDGEKDSDDAMDSKELIEVNNDIKYEDNEDVNNVSNINCNENIIANFKVDRLLNKNYLLLLISSYDTYDNEKINDLVWTLDNKKGRKIYEVNVKDKAPEKIKYPLNPDIYGFNINNLVIDMYPKSNNNIDLDEQTEVAAATETTMLFTFKLNSILNGKGLLINSNNISINITDSKGKTCDKDDANCENSINMQENNNIQDTGVLYVSKNYTVGIKINNNTYYIYDIGENIFNEDNTFFGLMIDNENITFYINNTKSTFKISNADTENSDGADTDIDTKNHIYMNKNKDCDFILYSFALFNKSICEADMKAYKMYNNYYMYGKKMLVST